MPTKTYKLRVKPSVSRENHVALCENDDYALMLVEAGNDLIGLKPGDEVTLVHKTPDPVNLVITDHPNNGELFNCEGLGHPLCKYAHFVKFLGINRPGVYEMRYLGPKEGE